LERGICLACENKSLRAQAQKAMAERDAAREQGQADYRALHDALVWAHEWHGKELPPPGRPVVAVLAEVKRLQATLEEIRELLLEEGNCDCPPEWPRCVECRIRLKIQVALKGVKYA
jgi:hypothetical protein